MPGRVKGANSDYRYDPAAKKIVEATATELFLDVFICPGSQPSRVEENGGEYCEGLKTSCPSKATGHARVHLSREEGASLASDNATVSLGQDGVITIEAKKSISITIGKTKLTINSSGVEVQGDLNVKGKITGDGVLTDADKKLLKQLGGGK